MHLIIGFFRIVLADVLSATHRRVHSEWIARFAVEQCCLAFDAGFGIDDAALDTLYKMGPDALRILEADVVSNDNYSKARVLKSLKVKWRES